MPALIIALIIGLTAATGGGMAYAARDALPDDALYPVKQAVDAMQVATSFSTESKAATHLMIAEEKLREVEALQERDAPGERIAKAAEQLAQHQTAAQQQLTEGDAKGKDVEALIAKLQANAARHQQVLERVLEKVPNHAKAAIRHAMAVSQQGLKNAVEQQTKAANDAENSELGRPESAGQAQGNPSSEQGLAPSAGKAEGRGKPAFVPSGR